MNISQMNSITGGRCLCVRIAESELASRRPVRATISRPRTGYLAGLLLARRAAAGSPGSAVVRKKIYYVHIGYAVDISI